MQRTLPLTFYTLEAFRMFALDLPRYMFFSIPFGSSRKWQFQFEFNFISLQFNSALFMSRSLITPIVHADAAIEFVDVNEFNSCLLIN